MTRPAGILKPLCTAVLALFVSSAASAISADGWAGENGGTTGGTGGAVVTVANALDYRSAVESTDTLIVRVNGTITLGGNDSVKPRPNKTIVGVGTTGKIVGTHILNASTRNIIIKNLTLTTFDTVSDNDAISIRGAQNVWIDHCTFYNSADGMVDAGLGADYITISWCKFYYTEDFGHNFVTLIGSNNSHGDMDEGRLKTTLHHNWYGTHCVGRMPMARFAKVHAYNNYYNAAGANMYFGLAWRSQFLVENSYFDAGNQSTGKIWHYYETNAKLRQTGNVFVNVPVNASGGDDEVFTPPYAYTLDDVGDVKSLVMVGAGVNGDEGEPVDSEAPEILSLVPSRATLWPPNHKMVPITIAAEVVDAVDPAPTVEIISVISNEAGGGNAPDWEITGDLTLNLRAERDGGGSGRIYLITVEARDAADNARTAAVQVTVRHDAGPDRAAPWVNLTAPTGGADLTGIVALTADALDVFGVAGVQFQVDGVAVGAEDTDFPYGVTWDTTAVSPGAYAVTAAARDAAGNTATSSAAVVMVLDQTPPAGVIISLTLIDADTDQPIAAFDPLLNGAVLDLSELSTPRLNVRANVSGSVGSIRFGLDANPSFRTESGAPYALAGDNSGDYNPWTPTPGNHLLTATAWSEGGAGGTELGSLSVDFTVTP